jgi:catechol 2,3-dioxygenase-like lactoylglutathione lyase family enzyme
MVDSSRAFSSYSLDDLDAAEAFYGATLGLDVTRQPEGLGITLGTGGQVFLYPKDDHRPATFTVLNFMVDDIAAAVDELTGQGITMARYDGFDHDERGIVAGVDGPHIAWFTDPAGNVLSVTQA